MWKYLLANQEMLFEPLPRNRLLKHQHVRHQTDLITEEGPRHPNLQVLAPLLHHDRSSQIYLVVMSHKTSFRARQNVVNCEIGATFTSCWEFCKHPTVSQLYQIAAFVRMQVFLLIVNVVNHEDDPASQFNSKSLFWIGDNVEESSFFP